MFNAALLTDHNCTTRPCTIICTPRDWLSTDNPCVCITDKTHVAPSVRGCNAQVYDDSLAREAEDWCPVGRCQRGRSDNWTATLSHPVLGVIQTQRGDRRKATKIEERLDIIMWGRGQSWWRSGKIDERRIQVWLGVGKGAWIRECRNMTNKGVQMSQRPGGCSLTWVCIIPKKGAICWFLDHFYSDMISNYFWSCLCGFWILSENHTMLCSCIFHPRFLCFFYFFKQLKKKILCCRLTSKIWRDMTLC